ncbi:hypothetical protein BO221_44165 [Archangium sp. Cb G35]|nr:hypothetical protein BO221_44165 [Archangium sp. Cb G35]
MKAVHEFVCDDHVLRCVCVGKEGEQSLLTIAEQVMRYFLARSFEEEPEIAQAYNLLTWFWAEAFDIESSGC